MHRARFDKESEGFEPLEYMVEHEQRGYVVKLKGHSWIIAAFVQEIEAQHYCGFRNELLGKYGYTDFRKYEEAKPFINMPQVNHVNTAH